MPNQSTRSRTTEPDRIVDQDVEGRLDARIHQDQHADDRDDRERLRPDAETERSELGPGLALGEQAGRDRHRVGDVEEQRAAGGQRGEGRRIERRRRPPARRPARSPQPACARSGSRLQAFEPGSPPSRAKAKIMREVEVRPASAQMIVRHDDGDRERSLSKIGAGRLLNRLNQALAPSLAAAARSGLAMTKDTAMTKPKTSDHSTEWIMPRGTVTRASWSPRRCGRRHRSR